MISPEDFYKDWNARLREYEQESLNNLKDGEIIPEAKKKGKGKKENGQSPTISYKG